MISLSYKDMIIVFGLFVFFVSVALEALLYFESKFWNKRKNYIISIAGILGLSLSILTPYLPLLFISALWIVSIYRLINQGRIYVSRLPSIHLHSISMRTFAVTSAIQALILVVYILTEITGFSMSMNDMLGFILLSSSVT